MSANTKPWIATLYFYLISAICVISMIFAGINGLMGLYTIIDPESNMDRYEWQAYSDIEQFKRSELNPEADKSKAVRQTPRDTLTEQSTLTDQEWEKRWQKHREAIIHGQMMSGKRNLVNMIIVIVVCLPLFFIHWRFARRVARAAGEADNSVDTSLLKKT